jgi:UPF0271 protein
VRMVLQHSVMSLDGIEVPLTGKTLCLHGDAPGAVMRAAALRQALEAAGISVAPPSRNQHDGT